MCYRNYCNLGSMAKSKTWVIKYDNEGGNGVTFQFIWESVTLVAVCRKLDFLQ